MLKDQLIELINKAAENAGCLVYESAVYLQGENSRLTVKIDKQGGVSHEDCDTYSKELALLVDQSELLEGYGLEISSPGINRKVRSIDEFIRFTGEPVKVIYSEDENILVAQGTIKDAKDGFVTVQEKNREIIISFNSIQKANLDY